MKTILKYISIMLFMTLILFLGMPTEAKATNSKPSNLLPTPQVFHIANVTSHCFTIPYTKKQLATEWDSLMALDINRLSQKDATALFLEKIFLNARYYAEEDSPTSTACFYYLSILILEMH